MQPQTGRRHAEEIFYFAQAELIVDREVLPEKYPMVELIREPATVVNYKAAGGELGAVAFEGRGQGIILEPGMQVVSIAGVDGGNTVAAHPVRRHSLLIARRHNEAGESQTVVIPANKPLPGNPAADRYELLGMINSRKLIAWGHKGYEARKLVDHLVANRLARNELDNYILFREVGFQGAISERFEADELVRSYIQWFREEQVQDFQPTQEPGDRMARYAGKLTKKQMKRYDF